MLTPINTNTNVYTIINHECTHFNVSNGSNNSIFVYEGFSLQDFKEKANGEDLLYNEL